MLNLAFFWFDLQRDLHPDLIKPISGHTSTRGVFRYLTKDGRALAYDY